MGGQLPLAATQHDQAAAEVRQQLQHAAVPTAGTGYHKSYGKGTSDSGPEQ